MRIFGFFDNKRRDNKEENIPTYSSEELAEYKRLILEVLPKYPGKKNEINIRGLTDIRIERDTTLTNLDLINYVLLDLESTGEVISGSGFSPEHNLYWRK